MAVVSMFGSALLFLYLCNHYFCSVCAFARRHTLTHTLCFSRFAFLFYMVVVISFHSHWKSFKQQMHKLLLNFVLLFLWEKRWNGCLRRGNKTENKKNWEKVSTKQSPPPKNRDIHMQTSTQHSLQADERCGVRDRARLKRVWIV